jgi:predicted metal-dependent hydrolase
MQNMAATEPASSDSTPPRYSSRPFPSARFVPGQTPRPQRTSHEPRSDQPERQPSTLLSPDQWQRSEAYRYGIDLYNYGYWWESHEVFEELWNGAGHRTEQGNFFQALIQLAAANLKYLSGNFQAAENLLRRGLLRLQNRSEFYMGIDVAQLAKELRQRIARSHWQAPNIWLALPDRKAAEVSINRQW